MKCIKYVSYTYTVETHIRTYRYKIRIRKTRYGNMALYDCKGIILHKDIKGHVDADYAGCWDTARSTSGCVFTYSGGAIAWTSKRQKCVATSTSEAENMAIKHGSDIAIWLRNVMGYLGRNL